MLKKYKNKNLAQYIIIENKSSVVLHGVHPGKRKKIQANKNGTPVDLHWKRRLKDSKIDGMVEIVAEENQVINQLEKNEEDLTNDRSNK